MDERKTALNPDIEKTVGQTPTALNPDVAGTNALGSTALNPAVMSQDVMSQQEIDEWESKQASLKVGTIIDDGYVIIGRMRKESGEAGLYLAKKDQKQFVVKHYRRENSIKPEVYELLLNNPHPNLPALYAVGKHDGRTYEVMEYYPKGSLEDELLTEDEIRNRFVPDMNEAIHKLHELGIVHKDIKPANIARKEDGHYVLMDFGISSVLKDGRSMLSTKTGFTPEYAPPEALNADSWSILVDYYSLGVTIYKLLLGVLPLDGMTDEEKKQFNAVHRFPVPKTVSEDIKTLILGLTYRDIDNRHDPTNPNNRWDYSFVTRWLAKEDMQIPGSNIAIGKQDEGAGNIRAFEVGDVICHSVDEILVALAENWQTGKKYLMRDNEITYDYFREEGFNKLAVACRDVADEGTDEAMMNFIYSNTSELDRICYNGVLDYPEEFGLRILKAIWVLGGDYGRKTLEDSHILTIITILNSGVLSKFYEARSRRTDRTDIGSSQEDQELASKYHDLVHEIEKAHSLRRETTFYEKLFELGYLLTGCPILYINGTYYKSYDEWLDQFENVMMTAKSEAEIDKFLDRFFVDRSDPKKLVYELQMKCWMKAIGRG